MKKKKIFISYSHKDEKWVKEWLLPRLENAGARVYIDFRDFQVGKPALVNMENAVNTCDHTLLVMTPNWVAGEWTVFEALMLQTIDPAGLQGRILPLMLEQCEPPLRLSMLTYADFRVKENWDTQFPRLLKRFDAVVSPAPRRSVEKEPQKLTLSKLPSTSGLLLGREKELDILDSAWDDQHTTIVTLVAFGGVGKTALVREWLNRMKTKNYRAAQRVYAWSFYSQGTKEDRQTSAEDFIDDALRWFGDPHPEQGSAWDKGKRLAQLVRERKTLLILDGLEPLQYPPGEMGGCLKDQSLQALLKELADLQPGLCIITTRVQVKDIESSENSSVKRIALENLTPVCGGQLLKALGVKGTELELRETAESFRGHALALRLLGRYLVVAHEGEIRKKDLVPGLTEEEEEGGHARRVMDSYERYLSGKPELNILYILGLFDRPAGMGAVDAVREEPLIDGLTVELKGISAYKWKSALAHLRQLDLLSTEEEGREEVLDCHPLVREHFGEKLRKNNPKSWQEAHARLYNYYKDLPEKKHPETLKEMEPLFTAVTHGCLAGKHQEALDEVFWSRIRRSNESYSLRKLGAFGFDLAALSGFFDNPWSQLAPGLIEAAQAFILNAAAFCLRALGRLREAAQPMEAAVTETTKQKDWRNAAQAASNLSELYLTLGEVKRSVEAARKSVELADKSEDAFIKYAFRTTLADALHQAGEVTEAGKWFREAEAMQKKRQPEYPYLYSVQGYQFCDLLLGQGQYEEVQKRAENGLKVAKESNLSLLTHALDTLTLGRARWLQTLDRGKRDFQPALDHLHRAVDGLRESGNQDDLPRGLLAHAAVYRTAKEFETARHDLEEAREIAERGAMKLHMADYHLESARLYHHMGKKQEALPHIETADKLIRETGYRRRDEEIEEIINY